MANIYFAMAIIPIIFFFIIAILKRKGFERELKKENKELKFYKYPMYLLPCPLVGMIFSLENASIQYSLSHVGTSFFWCGVTYVLCLLISYILGWETAISDGEIYFCHWIRKSEVVRFGSITELKRKYIVLIYAYSNCKVRFRILSIFKEVLSDHLDANLSKTVQ